MTERPVSKLSRRGLLGLGAAGAAILGLMGARNRWRTIGNLRHQSSSTGASEFNDTIVVTITSFLGAVFGIAMTEDDRADLQGRLRYALTHDDSWLDEYGWLAAHVNDAARALGANSFAEASVAVQTQVVESAFAMDLDRRGQRMRAFFRPDGRKLLRMRRSTLQHLVRLYRYSGVPWRHRGYSSWPGVAADQLAYTRDPGIGKC